MIECEIDIEHPLKPAHPNKFLSVWLVLAMRRLCMILSCYTATHWSQLRVIVSEFRWQLWLSGVALRTQACDLILNVGVNRCHGLQGCAACLQSLTAADNHI